MFVFSNSMSRSGYSNSKRGGTTTTTTNKKVAEVAQSTSTFKPKALLLLDKIENHSLGRMAITKTVFPKNLQQFLPDDFVPFSVSSFHSVHHLVVVGEPGALFPHLVQRLRRGVHTAQRKYFPLLAPGQELATGLIHGFAVLVQVQHVD